MTTLAFLSNVTINASFLKTKFKNFSDLSLSFPSGYNTWRQYLLEQKNECKPDAIILLLDGKAWLEQWEFSYSATIISECIRKDIGLIEEFRRNDRNPPIFVSTMDIPQFKLRPIAETGNEYFVMSEWRKEIGLLQLPLIDVQSISAKIGQDNFYSASGWYAGRCPWSLQGQKIIADEVERVWRIWNQGRKKVLVLDLDNTLWGGIIGEDGLTGIKLGCEGIGAAYRDFQLKIKELKASGIILAIVSKNNLEDALEPIKNHPDMVLREDDFIAIKANWQSKTENIVALASELNLGLDSFVFIDDNPVERGAIRQSLPEVSVPDFPRHPFLLGKFLNDVAGQWFTPLKLTTEDLTKTQAYQAESKRKLSRKNYSGLDDYLKSLCMRVVIERATINDVPRLTQMTQKTNQFNLTTQRYSESDMDAFIHNPKMLVLKATLKDNFGDYGIILLLILEFINKEQASINTLLMSCRAMDRKVEYAFIKSVENMLVSRGLKELYGRYLPTGKNGAAADFYENAGFKKNAEAYWIKQLSHNQEDELIIVENALINP